MSNLKDTDIDELFQRASDKYPLRTDGADWDRMAAALEKEPPAPPAADAEEKRRKRRFFWLFLLLPLAGAGYYAWHHAGTTAAAVTTNAASTTATANTTGAANTTTTASTTGAASTTSTAVATNAAGDAATKNTAGQDIASQTAITQATTGQTAGGQTASAPTKNHSSHPSVYNSTTPNEETKVDKETKPDNSLSLTAANTGRQPGGERYGGEKPGSATPGSEKFANDQDRLFYDLQRAPISRDYRLTVNVTAPTVKKDTAKTKSPTKTKHFYAGVFGSPDLSTVKMQSVKGVGSTFGIILGYTFNGGHWAIETGVNVDRKKYYTDGEYFNTKEIHLPANTWLTNVDGICYMWEIPLNVRYNFNPGAKTSWFATAGLSTYLMSHEKYAYGLQWAGSSAVYDSTWNFHKPSQYPFSIINLSAGFEQRLGKIGNLRVEPYVRLPLTGLGTGKLPIMSAGVNIGITRQLW